MKIAEVNDHNRAVYLNLAQCYEGEFSFLTRKTPDVEGRFALDTELGGPITGYLLYVEGIPAGLAAVLAKAGRLFEVCEFYVVPSFRNRKWGRRFAHGLWTASPGEWEVKQIAGAENASSFWRKCLEAYGVTWSEDTYEDPYWGPVTRQRFSIVVPLSPSVR